MSDFEHWKELATTRGAQEEDTTFEQIKTSNDTALTSVGLSSSGSHLFSYPSFTSFQGPRPESPSYHITDWPRNDTLEDTGDHASGVSLVTSSGQISKSTQEGSRCLTGPREHGYGVKEVDIHTSGQKGKHVCDQPECNGQSFQRKTVDVSFVFYVKLEIYDLLLLDFQETYEHPQ